MNPQTIGPFNSTSTPALASGTAISFGIDNSAVAIQIHNDSPLRLYVAFDGRKPSATIAQSGTYQGVAGPWSHPVIMVRPQYSTFQGTVWLMPVDVSMNLAQTGTVSSLAEVHVDVYGPGDALPQSWAMPRQQDMTSQPRWVSVPMGLPHWNFGRWLTTDPNPLVLITFTPSAAQLAALRMPIYLYYANIAPEATATVGNAVDIEIQWQTAGGVNVGTPFVLAQGSIVANTTNLTMTPWVFAPSWPIAYIGGGAGNIPPTAAKGLAQLRVVVGAHSLNIDYTVAISADPTNLIGDGDIGVQALYGQLGLGNPLF